MVGGGQDERRPGRFAAGLAACTGAGTLTGYAQPAARAAGRAGTPLRAYPRCLQQDGDDRGDSLFGVGAVR